MIRSIFVGLFLFSLIPGGMAAKVTEAPESTLTVRFYNWVEAPRDEVLRAMEVASAVFRRAGTEVAWLECTVGVPDAACDRANGPAVLNLRLRRATEDPTGTMTQATMGQAFIGRAGSFGRTADVYFDRLEPLADGRKIRRAEVLGSMIAHELGHLLLGAHSHSKKGLMAGPWDPAELLAASQGILGFSKREVERVQKDVLARAAASTNLAR